MFIQFFRSLLSQKKKKIQISRSTSTQNAEDGNRIHINGLGISIYKFSTQTLNTEKPWFTK